MRKSMALVVVPLLASVSCQGLGGKDLRDPEAIFQGVFAHALGGRISYSGREMSKTGSEDLSPDAVQFELLTDAPFDDYDVCASRADTIVDPYNGDSLPWAPGDQWCTYETGVEGLRADIVLSPLNDIVYHYALDYVANGDRNRLPQAYESAPTKVLGTFLCAEPQPEALLRVAPIDLRSDTAPTTLGAAGAVAIVSCAFSKAAATANETLGYAPNARIVMNDVVTAWNGEVSNGFIDGFDQDGNKLRLNAIEIEGDDLMSAPWGFIHSLQACLDDPEANRTGLTSDDFTDWFACLTSRSALSPEQVSRDTRDPQVVWSVPVEGRANGIIAATCTARDDESDIKSMTVKALRVGAAEPVDASLFHGSFTAGPDKFAGTWSGTFDSAEIDDGEYDFICEGSDLFDNLNQDVVRVSIDNSAGLVQCTTPGSEETVRGQQVHVACTCADPQTTCVLTEPTSNVTCSEPADDSPGTRECVWDSTGVVDGEQIFVCEGQSGDLEPARSSVSRVVDNVTNGRICEFVFAESLVRGSTVTAYAFRDAVRGRSLGSSFLSEGGGCVTMADNYSGPVLLEAAGVMAVYTSGMTGHDTQLQDATLTLLIDDYQAGEVIDGDDAVVLNYMSTLAADLTIAYVANPPSWISDQSFLGLSAMAHFMIGHHPRVDGATAIDVRRVRPRDFVTQSAFAAFDGEESTIMGLMSLGVAWVGARYTAQFGGAVEAKPGIRTLQLLRQDLADSVFDGYAGRTVQLYWTSDRQQDAKVTVEAFRLNLAEGMRSWVGGDTLGGRLAPMNHSGLTVATYNGRFGLFETIATDHSMLFDPTQPVKPWDTIGPTITVVVKDVTTGAEVDMVAGVPFVHRQLEVAVLAQDDSSGVASVTVSIDGTDGTAVRSGTLAAPGQVQTFVVESMQLADRTLASPAYVLRVGATDGIGNVTDDGTRKFRVDNTPPTVTMVQLVSPAGAQPGWVRSTEAQIEGAVGDNNGVTSLVFLVSGEPVLVADQTVPMTGAFSQLVPLPGCSASFDVSVQAVDVANNVFELPTAQAVQVFCDDQWAKVGLTSSMVAQERKAVNFIYNSDGVFTCYELSEQLNNNSLDLQLATWPLALEKSIILLDEPTRAYLGGNCRPAEALKFFANDAPASVTVGTAYTIAVGGLSVAYRYLFNGTQMRGWTALVPATDGGEEFSIPLSYQALLPVGARPDDNFIAKSTPSDVHTIEIRITDQAGNVTPEGQYTYSFSLKLFGPPAKLSNCQLAHDVTSLSLIEHTVDSYFTPGAKHFATAQLEWAIPFPTGSLVPRTAVDVTVAGALMTASIDELHADLASVPGTTRNCTDVFPLELDQLNACIEGDDGHKYQWADEGYRNSGNCYDGFAPDPNGATLPIDVPPQSIERTLSVSGATPSGLGYQLVPGRAATIAVDTSSPTMFKDGQVWNWPVYNYQASRTRTITHYEYEYLAGRSISYTNNNQVSGHSCTVYDWHNEHYVGKFSLSADWLQVSVNHPSLPRLSVDLPPQPADEDTWEAPSIATGPHGGTGIAVPNISVQFVGSCQDMGQAFSQTWSDP